MGIVRNAKKIGIKKINKLYSGNNSDVFYKITTIAFVVMACILTQNCTDVV